MNNQLFGILSITLCSIGYFFSWRFQLRSKYKTALVLLILCGLILRIFISADFFLHDWDERYHALVAKNLIHHPLSPTLYDNPILQYNYRDWTANHIWLHKQPLALWTMAMSMWLFGINEFALRLPSIILSSIGIGLTFFIGKYFFNSKTGFLAAFFYSMNGLILELTAGRSPTDHIDIIYLFFIELSIFFCVLYVQNKKTLYNVLAGLGLGASILCKWLPALIVLPVWLLLITDSGKFKTREIILQCVLLLSVCFIVFLPWQFYIYYNYPVEASLESSFNYRHLTDVIEGHSGSFLYYLDNIRIYYGDLIYIPLVWFVWRSIRDVKNKKHLAITIWFLIPCIFFSIIKTKMPAYLLFASPALFFITADFYYAIAAARQSKKWKWLIVTTMALLIALPVRYMTERVKPFDRSNRTPDWTIDLRKLNDRNIFKGILFNYGRPIEAMFYTNLTTYPIIPDKNKIIELLSQGYTIIINDEGNIPEDIKSLDGIIIENFKAQ